MARKTRWLYTLPEQPPAVPTTDLAGPPGIPDLMPAEQEPAEPPMKPVDLDGADLAGDAEPGD